MQEITNTESALSNEDIAKPAFNAEDSLHESCEEVQALPSIPGKHYFTIGEMSRLCQIKPHVLRYWEHEFPQLKNIKRRGNRRYYTRQQVITVRQIRSLLHEQGYTIPGAKARLAGKEEHKDSSQTKQLIRQFKSELEDVLAVLQRTEKAS